MNLHKWLPRSSLPPRSILLVIAIFLASCADERGSPLTPPLEPELTGISQASSTEEQAALDSLTRAVALALQDQGLRQRIKNDMRTAPIWEHKLEFSNYIKGASGGILLAKMSQVTGKSRSEILALMESVRPLEFYMPVREHRARWTGGSDLLVASQLEDEDTPHAYDLQGRAVVLDLTTAPATPVLSIVPVETDFTRPLDLNEWTNVDDRGGEAIGNYRRRSGGSDHDAPMEAGINYIDPGCDPEIAIIPCDDGGGGGGSGGGGSKPGGLYMTRLYLPDLGEPWTKGDPEIEVHIHGPNGGDKTYGADLACAGERQTDYRRYFNQNNNTWTGEVLLFDQAQLTDYYNKYGNQGFNIMVWEDDDTACVIKTDKNITQSLLLIAGAAGAAATVVAPVVGLTGWLKAAGSFIGAVYASASWLKSNDDFLGAAPQVTDGATRSEIWMSPTKKNGYMDTSIRYMQ